VHRPFELGVIDPRVIGRHSLPTNLNDLCLVKRHRFNWASSVRLPEPINPPLGAFAEIFSRCAAKVRDYLPHNRGPMSFYGAIQS
jgi:hypothetical protein